MSDFSPEYYVNAEKCKDFHNSRKSWRGTGTCHYILDIKKHFDENNCKSLLDYGCGRGFQYEEGCKQINGQLMSDFLNLKDEDIFKYDIGVEKYSIAPAQDQKWDMTICLDMMLYIPPEDVDAMLQTLDSHTNKVLYIGMQFGKPKAYKPVANQNPRTWWEERFANWKGRSKLVLNFRSKVSALMTLGLLYLMPTLDCLQPVLDFLM